MLLLGKRLRRVNRITGIIVSLCIVLGCAFVPIQAFAAPYIDSWDDGAGKWTTADGFKLETVPDETGVGSSMRISTSRAGVSGDRAVASYTPDTPVAIGGLTVISFRYKLSHKLGNRFSFSVNDKHLFMNHESAGTFFLDYSPGVNIYEEPSEFTPEEWHEVKLVINRQEGGNNINGVMSDPGNGQYGVYYDGVLQNKSGGNGGKIPSNETTITKLSWGCWISGEISDEFSLVMDDLKIYSEADPLPYATVALNESFDVLPTGGFESILHKVNNGITGITGALGPYVTSYEALKTSVPDPSEDDRSLRIVKQMTPVEHTYQNENIALIAKKTFQPIEIPTNGNATLEVDVKLTEVNATDPGGGWVSRYMLINDNWSYNDKTPSGIFLRFGEDKLGDKYALYNGTTKTDFGYEEERWYKVKLYFENDGATTYYTPYIDDVQVGGRTDCGNIASIKSLSFGNRKSHNQLSVADVGVQLNNLKVCNNLITFASGARPAAVNVKIGGEAAVGNELTADYRYHHEDGKSENGTSFRWLRSETAKGSYTPVTGADEATYQVRQDDLNKFIICEVTPKDSDDTAGAAYMSKPAKLSAAPVTPVPTADEEDVAAAGEALVIDAPDVTAITESLTLPTQTDNGCTVVWESDNIRAIKNDGTVTRDATDAVTFLTAIITKGSARTVKEFKVRVKGIEKENTAAVDLTPYYSMDRFGYEGETGLWRYDAEWLYEKNIIDGVPYQFGAFEGSASNAILMSGQTVDLTPKKYGVIYMLGSGAAGGAEYRINYTDGTKDTVRADAFGDWQKDESRNKAVLRSGSMIGPSNGVVIDSYVGGIFRIKLYPNPDKAVESIELPTSYNEIYAISVSENEEEGDEPIRIAFAGDSITQGQRCAFMYRNAFPYQLRRMLGSRFTTFNFGVSGTTMQKESGGSYWGMLPHIEAVNPDAVVIMLGSNDVSGWNQTKAANYERDYREMIATIRAFSSHPKVYACLPPTMYDGGIERNGSLNEVMEIIRRIEAEDPELTVIDINSATSGMPEKVPDGLHPNAEGHIEMAKAMYKVLKSYGADERVIKFEIGEPQLSYEAQDGEAATGMTSNGRATVTVNARNASPGSRAKTIFAVAALFDNNGLLTRAANTTVTFSQDENKEVSLELALPEDIAGKTIRLYMWEKGSLVPLVNAVK